MIRGITDWFEDFPEEARLISAMVIAYGEIEFGYQVLLDEIVGDEGSAPKMFYTIRGEGQRIDVCDALIRPVMKTHRLDGRYGEMLGGLRRCKNIRNQYAHSHWETKEGRLAFGSLAAGTHEEDGYSYTMYFVEKELLEEQAELFRVTDYQLIYLSCELQKRMGKMQKHKHVWPRMKRLPSLLPEGDD